MKRSIFALVLAAISMLGCASRHLKVEEEALDTDGSITSQFHSVLYYPFELSPRFDGYLVGIEKVPRPDGGINVKNRTEYGHINDSALEAKFSDSKVMAVTHIIRHFADAQKFTNCTVFNAYVQPKTTLQQLVPACDSEHLVAQEPNMAFSNSWKALDALGEDMKVRIDAHKPAVATASASELSVRTFGHAPEYTHIVVLVMGWNTVQAEAVRNINSLVWNMHRAHGEQVKKAAKELQAKQEPPFNPLIIGVTWPSQWSSDWLDPAIKIVSFPTKAGDADEVGMSWLGVLLHETLPKVQPGKSINSENGLPIVVLGHSFGAKASSVAACAGPAIVRAPENPVMPLSKIDVLVNLEPAYLSERVFGPTSWLKNVIYPHGCPQADRFVITSSKGDKAVPLPFWGTYLGEDKSYKKFCSAIPDGLRIAHCATAKSDGRVEAMHVGTSNIYYVDASMLISENAYGSGGYSGSHSDIYRLEHGKFLYNAIMGEDLWAKSPK